MTQITVSMEWEIEEGFRYHVTASEEVPAHGIPYGRQRLHNLCREHRQIVQAAVAAYNQRGLHQRTAMGHAGWAANELASIEEHKGHPHYSIQDGVSRKSAARRQIAAGEAQAKADAITVDEDWLPW